MAIDTSKWKIHHSPAFEFKEERLASVRIGDVVTGPGIRKNINKNGTLVFSESSVIFVETDKLTYMKFSISCMERAIEERKKLIEREEQDLRNLKDKYNKLHNSGYKPESFELYKE